MEEEKAQRPPDRNSGLGSWRIRRRFMFACTLFCMLTVAYVLHYEMDSRPAETAITMAFITIASIVGSYVFGATWDDHSARQDRRSWDDCDDDDFSTPRRRRF